MSALYKEAKVIANSGSLAQLCCREGGTMQTNITGMCGEWLQCGATLGMSEPKVACASWVYTAQVLSCSARVLSQVGPAFHAPPRSKQLRFSSTPKGTDLDGLCILCPSQVWAAQMTRSLASALSYVGHASYSPPWFQPLSFPGVPREPSLSCAVCLFWGSDLRLWYLCQISAVQDPRKMWWTTGSLLTVWWKMRSLGPKIAAAACLQALAIALLPLRLCGGRALYDSRLALL